MNAQHRVVRDAVDFISEYRNLGGEFTVLDDPAGGRWFGVMNPPSGFNNPRAGEMRCAIVASPSLEAAIIAQITREGRPRPHAK